VPSRIAFVIVDGFELLDLAGPFEVFQQANRLSGGCGCEVVSRKPGPVRPDNGLQVNAGQGVRDCAPSSIDTLVVAGGTGVDTARDDAALAGWIAAAAAGARRVTSVCSVACSCSRRGLVSGRRVTSHWSRAGQLAREHPEAVVDCDPIFIQDGPIWTSAGVTAGMDLALALVDDDLGRDVALTVARELVLFSAPPQVSGLMGRALQLRPRRGSRATPLPWRPGACPRARA
jgi:transcriptional regulator GlxA family with amidase domain